MFSIPFLNLIYLLLLAFETVNIADFNSAILGEKFWLLYIRWPEGGTKSRNISCFGIFIAITKWIYPTDMQDSKQSLNCIYYNYRCKCL